MKDTHGFPHSLDVLIKIVDATAKIYQEAHPGTTSLAAIKYSKCVDRISSSDSPSSCSIPSTASFEATQHNSEKGHAHSTTMCTQAPAHAGRAEASNLGVCPPRIDLPKARDTCHACSCVQVYRHTIFETTARSGAPRSCILMQPC